MGDGQDTDLPEVIRQVWDSIRKDYDLKPLDGPVDSKVLSRDARKWYATAEPDGNIVSIDFYVLVTENESIPGVTAVRWGDRTRYWRSGLASIDNPELAYTELKPSEVEALRPGVPIKVVIESMEPEMKTSTGIKKYKPNEEDLKALYNAISAALDQMKVPKKVKS